MRARAFSACVNGDIMKKKLLCIGCISLAIIALTSFASCGLYEYPNKQENSSSTGGFTPEISQDGQVNIIITDPSLYNEYITESLPQVISRVKSSVVGIKVNVGQEAVIGTGTVIANSDNGLYTYIATSHSLLAGATSVVVQNFARGDEFNATPVGTDPVTDICIIRINANLTPATFYTDTSSVMAGQEVFALANAMGQQTVIVNDGIISAAGYKLDVGEGNVNEIFLTNLNLRSTSFGGGLFAKTGGFLLGMVCASEENSSHSYVIPADTLRNISAKIIEKGYVEGRYKLGVTVKDNKSGWGITESVSVSALEQDGSIYANGLGLEVDDIILSIVYGGTTYTIQRAEAFYSYLYSFDFKIGDVVTFNVERKGARSQISVEIKQYNYFNFEKE